jgi:hypothetical protein
MITKRISISKLDLLDIIAWTYVKGLFEGHNSKKGRFCKKPYREAKKFIMDVYWYKK